MRLTRFTSYSSIVVYPRTIVIDLEVVCQVPVSIDFLLGHALLSVRVEVSCRIRTLTELARCELDALDLLPIARQANLARVGTFVDRLRVHLRFHVDVDELFGILI